MTDIQNKFFQILRCAINVDIDAPELSVTEWKQIYTYSGAYPFRNSEA